MTDKQRYISNCMGTIIMDGNATVKHDTLDRPYFDLETLTNDIELWFNLDIIEYFNNLPECRKLYLVARLNTIYRTTDSFYQLYNISK